MPRIVVRHSPTGFNYGYGGSGPSDLALNLAQAVATKLGYKGDTSTQYGSPVFKAVFWFYHPLSRVFIAPLDQDKDHVIPYEDVANFVKAKLAEFDAERF